MLELRHRQLSAHVEWCNQLNTQARSEMLGMQLGRDTVYAWFRHACASSFCGTHAGPQLSREDASTNLCALAHSHCAQAMLVAGSAVASLGGESLQSIEPENVLEQGIGTLFVASTAATLCWCRRYTSAPKLAKTRSVLKRL